MEGQQNILFISDTHFGHSRAAMPEGWVNPQTGNVVGQNSGQAYLDKCWKHMLTQVPMELDGLIVVGDVIEGRQPAAKAGGLTLQEPIDQVKLAEHYLRPLVARVKQYSHHKRNVYFAAGTRYHVGNMSEYEEALGYKLDAQSNELGGYVHDWVQLKSHGVKIDAEHTQSYHQRYRATGLEKAIGFARERYSREGRLWPRGYVLVRAHAHYGLVVYREEGVLAISLPPWKLQDDYAATSTVPNRMIPYNLGAVLVTTYKEESMRHKVVEYTPYLYNHPPRKEAEIVTKL